MQRLSRYAAPRGQRAECGRVGVSTPGPAGRVQKGGCLHPGASGQSAEGWVSPPRGQRAECGRVGVSTTGTASRAVRNGGSLHHGDSEQSHVEQWVSPQRLCCASSCQVCARLLPRGRHCM